MAATSVEVESSSVWSLVEDLDEELEGYCALDILLLVLGDSATSPFIYNDTFMARLGELVLDSRFTAWRSELTHH